MVDNYIPVKNGYPAFSRAQGKELWVLMLEKAWAKIHKSYERIESGDTQLTVRDLTGAPGKTYDLTKQTEDIFELMAEADAKDHIICASIDQASPEESKQLQELGLVDRHAYSIITVKDVGVEKICRIRNPWGGEFEWKGEWSDLSDKWTDDLK
jgi:hypothetical protein